MKVLHPLGRRNYCVNLLWRGKIEWAHVVWWLLRGCNWIMNFIEAWWISSENLILLDTFSANKTIIQRKTNRYEIRAERNYRLLWRLDRCLTQKDHIILMASHKGFALNLKQFCSYMYLKGIRVMSSGGFIYIC